MHMPLIVLPLIGMPGMWEWILIALVIMLFFGAAKLPKLGKGLGEGIRNFKKGLKSDNKAKDQEDKKLEAAEDKEDKEDEEK